MVGQCCWEKKIQIQSECCTVCLGGWGSSPFLDTVQVKDVEAALAAPHRGHEPYHFTAHHALVLLLRQLFNQTPCGWTSAEVQTRVTQLLFSHTGRVFVRDVKELFNVASNSLTCLRLLALWHLVAVLLAWPLVLMMGSSSPSGLKGCVSS